MPHLLGDSQLLRRGLLGEACVDEGLGGSVSVESGSGCVTAGSGVCVWWGTCAGLFYCVHMCCGVLCTYICSAVYSS